MGALHIPLSWHVLEDSPFSCLPPRQEYRTVEPNVNLSPLSTPLGGEPGWPQSTTSRHGKRKADALLMSMQALHYCWNPSDSSERVYTHLYTRVGVCPTVLLADKSAQVIRTSSILGYSQRKPQCRRWSSRTQFYSGEWSWRGFLDQSSWPLHTERRTQGNRYTKMETKHVLFGKHQGGSLLSPFLHFWSVSVSKTNTYLFMHLGPGQRLGNVD